MKTKLLLSACLAVLAVTLTLGLWPFHSPRSNVSWLSGRNGLRFGRDGVVLSSRSVPFLSPDRSDWSLELWFRARFIWDYSTLLAFFDLESQSQFSIRQSQADFLLETAVKGDSAYASRRGYVADVFRRGEPALVSITCNRESTRAYVDGVLKSAWPLVVPIRALNGQLVVGDSVRQPDSWAGEFFGIAMFRRELAATRILQHYAQWKQNGRPELTDADEAVALYTFDERSGRVVRDKTRSGLDLVIPERYQVLDKVALEPFWREFEMTSSFWRAALKNIVGFVPLGFCFFAYLATVLAPRRPILLTVAAGACVSLTIEILQAFLPTRDSGTTDILTNTLGTWIGVVLYPYLAPTIVQLSSRLLPTNAKKAME